MQEVVDLPVIRAGGPRVLAAADRLERPVRWVHVVDSAAAGAQLDGHELLLSTGIAWPASDDGLTDYLANLLDSGISGLILELGQRFSETPRAAVDLFGERGVPLVSLDQAIPFVRVTSEVHRRIIEGQTSALRARDAVHELFTGMSLRGSPVDYIVEELARELGTTVVLEDLDHRVIVAAGHGEASLLHWQAASRQIHRRARWTGGPTGRSPQPEGTPWFVTPVEARGIRWGHLLASPGPQHPAGRATVMEQAAMALALDRLTDDQNDRWLRLSHRRLVDSMLSGRYRSTQSLSDAFEAAGFPLRGRTLLALSLSVEGHPRINDFVPIVRDAVASLGAVAIPAILEGRSASGTLVAAISIPASGQASDAWVGRLGRILDSHLSRSDGAASLVIGHPAVSIEGLLDSIQEVRTSGRSPSATRIGQLAVSRPSERPLEQLLAQLRSDVRVHAYVASTLRPLIDHEAEFGGDLFAVLGAYLSHPGNRSRAAQSSLVSRSVFYQRLAQIEDLLGVDLSDGSVMTSLHAALIAHRASVAD